MKKVLLITPACHFRNTGAAQRDIYAAIALLQKLGHMVALYTIDSGAQDQGILDEVSKRYGIEIKKFRPQRRVWSWIGRFLVNPSLFDRAAYVFDELQRDSIFRSYVTGFKPDVVVSFCSYSWPVIKFAKQQGIKTVLRSHNFESNFFWESLTVAEKFNPLNTLRRIAKYRGEWLAAKLSDTVGTLPVEQVTKYRAWKSQGVHILTLLFLPESLREPVFHADKIPLDLFYLGASYNISFHRRGVELLIKEIAPLVEKLAPGKFRFHICGGKLPPELAAACTGAVHHEGYVPDLEGFLAGMDAGVFPVMFGKTMKGKVFETLARGFPMVISTNCLGGYNLRDGEEALIADTVADFTAKIILLANGTIRQKIAHGAAAFSQAEFSEEKIISVLEQLLGS